MGQRCRLGLWAGLVLLVASPVLADSIARPPLWSLTSQSELIVVARVASTEDLPEDDGSGSRAVAHLQVLETLKGPKRHRADVLFRPLFICPEPPRYAESETVVTFLQRDGEYWRTLGWSYGTLYSQDSELGHIAAAIRAAVAIQESPETERVKRQRKLEWLVQAAIHPQTRWHGLVELLAGKKGAQTSKRRSGQKTKQRDRFRLTRPHRKALAKALVEEPRPDPTFAMMLEILGSHEDSQVDRIAVATLDGLMAMEEPPWWHQDLLWATLSRFGDRRLEKRLEDQSTNRWDVTPDQLQELWSQAKLELRIPKVLPRDLELH